MAEESAHHRHRVSVVIPTFCRPEHLADSLGALESQTVKPTDVVVIDGSPPSDDRSELLLKREADRLEFAVLYLRASGGAAVQRNIGIDHATEDYVFFVDDDVQPDPGCLEMLLSGLEQDESRDYAAMGGQSRSNKSPLRAWRWRIYSRIGLLGTSRPGSFDRLSGHAIPRATSPTTEGLVDVDFVGGGCALWRRSVFESGLRFSDYFDTYFYNEDVHLCLRARALGLKLGIVGSATFHHSEASAGRHGPEVRARHGAINRRFVFVDIVKNRTNSQEWRFWAVEAAEAALVAATVPASRSARASLRGRVSGLREARRRWPGPAARTDPRDRSMNSR